MSLNRSVAKQDSRIVLSVVIPAFNEELVIEETIVRIGRVLSDLKIRSEILVVNDGSQDGTLAILRRLRKTRNIRVINFDLNVGHMSAIRAGLEASVGEYIVTIDSDLQDPPEYIPEMLKIISTSSQSGQLIDVIQTYRDDRATDTFWKRGTASLYYKAVRQITGISLLPHGADFRMMRRSVVETLISLPEQKLVYRLLIPSLGFHIAPFPIKRDTRFAGKSKYSNRKMIGLAIDSILGFTFRPLRFFATIGMISSVVLFIGSIFTLFVSMVGNTVPGWPSLVLLTLSFNAFLFAGLGLVGEYVGRIYQIVQGRPRIPWYEI